jgi:outer membrane protein OmpA-like peptidoglycan-associated protein
MKRSLIVTAGAALLLTGCTSLTQVISMQTQHVTKCGRSRGIVLIVGAHRDAPAPSLDARVACQVAAAVSAGRLVLLVEATGQPVMVKPRLLSVHGGTLAQQGSPRAEQDVVRVTKAIADLRPEAPGVDDLAALSVAADAARSAGAPHAELVLLDSGLDDRGALDFTVPGMVSADPAEVAHQLRAEGNEPDLRGFTLELVGIGYTSLPQPPLADKWRSNVTQIWQAVASSSGARADIIPQPAEGPSVRTSEPVKLVPVPPDQPMKPAPRRQIVFTDESPVRFEPNTTTFVDRAAATRALVPLARWLQANPARHASLVGTTADVGPMSGQVTLARGRAARVYDELVVLGASSRQISWRGVGSDFSQFIPDRNAAGILLAGPAALNRSVRITLTQRP